MLSVIACPRCGLLRLDPLPAAEELIRFYESEYRQSYKGVRSPKLKHVYRAGMLAVSRLHRIGPRLGARAQVLDVGCGSGEWLYALRAVGHTPTGIEPDPGYAEFGRQEYGVDILTGPVLGQPPCAVDFDCVTLFHVLEHVPQPVEALRRIHEWTKDGGLLVIEVPNMVSVHQHPVKRFHYAHVIGFTPTSLSAAITGSGWRMLEMSVGSYDRNLFAIAAKPSGNRCGASVDISAPGPPSHAAASVSSLLRYYSRPTTYVRWIERMSRFAEEYWAVRGHHSARAILESTLRAAGIEAGRT